MTAIGRSADAKAAAIRRSMTHSGRTATTTRLPRSARAVDHRPRPSQTRSAAPGRVAGHRPGPAARSARPARSGFAELDAASQDGRSRITRTHQPASIPRVPRRAPSHSLCVGEIASQPTPMGRIDPPSRRHGLAHHARLFSIRRGRRRRSPPRCAATFASRYWRCHGGRTQSAARRTRRWRPPALLGYLACGLLWQLWDAVEIHEPRQGCLPITDHWHRPIREGAGDGGGAAGDVQPFVDGFQVGGVGQHALEPLGLQPVNGPCGSRRWPSSPRPAPASCSTPRPHPGQRRPRIPQAIASVPGRGAAALACRELPQPHTSRRRTEFPGLCRSRRNLRI